MASAGFTLKKSNSSVVRAFVQTQQQIELREQVAGFTVYTEASKRRRSAIEKRKGGKLAKKEATFSQTVSKAEQFRNMDEHRVPIEELYKRFETNQETGLNQGNATQMNAKLGDNVLTQKQLNPWYIRLFKELTSLFAWLLWCGGGLCFAAYGIDSTHDPSNLYLGIVLWLVLIFCSIYTVVQNSATESIMEGFKNFIPPKANCLRDGTWRSMDAVKLVPGDIIKVKFGDKIPADIRIVNSKEMKVDNSSLTGETDALLRTPECTNKDNPLETANLAFFGTLCKEGEAIGVVIKIGDSTVIGQIANLAASAATSLTPLNREINRFIRLISCIAISLGILFFCLGFVVGYDALTNFVFGIGICVANVPEGVPAMLAAALTIAARKMARKKVLVRKLEAVETLGSTSCICSDKTGTLTQNIMTVQHMWYDSKLVTAENKQKRGSNFAYEYDEKSLGFRYLHECAIVCSEAYFNLAPPDQAYAKLQKITDPIKADQEKRRIDAEHMAQLEKVPFLERPTVGDASETALIKFYQAIEDITKTRNRYKIRMNDNQSESKIPFNSVNKFAIYIVEYPTENSEYCMFIKGAPERVWAMCDKIYSNGVAYDLDEGFRKNYADVNMKLAKGGERVLGFAKVHLPKNEYPKGFQFNCSNIKSLNVPLQHLAFLGLISLIDPPREAVPYAVLKCKSAGIKVIMVTGDQPITAAAIAKKCNIISEKTPDDLMEENPGMSYEAALRRSRAIVIHGDQLAEAMREDEGLPEKEKGRKLANWLMKPQIVFARTSPAQKLIIVQGCQKLGHCVAVTGDGINDAPAIKMADIGIAMGITGTDVAKDAADMILLNDDFSSIIMGVEEGRKIFDNLKRSIVYILTSNVAEMMPFIIFIIFQFPLPLSSILILCTSLGTDMVPSISFVTEEGELDIMTRSPRMSHEHMITRKLLVYSYMENGILEAWPGMLTYFAMMRDFGFPIWSTFYSTLLTGLPNPDSDVYDETMANLGNSDAGCDANDNLISLSGAEIRTPDYLYLSDKYVDLRMMYITCSGGKIVQNYVFGDCLTPQLSGVTFKPICYSTEVVKYAQAGFFYSIVFTQMTNLYMLKTRVGSMIWQGHKNSFAVFSVHFEGCLMLTLGMCYPFNVALGTRDNLWYYYGIPGLPLGMWMLIHEEVRKWLIRNFPKPDPQKDNWFYRNALY